MFLLVDRLTRTFDFVPVFLVFLFVDKRTRIFLMFLFVDRLTRTLKTFSFCIFVQLIHLTDLSHFLWMDVCMYVCMYFCVIYKFYRVIPETPGMGRPRKRQILSSTSSGESSHETDKDQERTRKQKEEAVAGQWPVAFVRVRYTRAKFLFSIGNIYTKRNKCLKSSSGFADIFRCFHNINCQSSGIK